MVLKRWWWLLAFLMLVPALAQTEKPLLVGGTVLTAEYPGGFGVSYVEARPFAQALGLMYWASDGEVILGLGSRRLRFVVTPVPRSKTALKKLVVSESPPALRRGERVLLPVCYTARAFGALYSGSETSLKVLLPDAEMQGFEHRVIGGRDVVVLRTSRDVNALRDGAGWWLLGLRAGESVRDVPGLYLSRVRFAPGEYGTRVYLDGSEGWPVDVAYFPGEVRFYVGPPAERRAEDPPLVVIDPGHGGTDVGARYGNLFEKDLTLKVAREAAARLRRMGYRVELTRDRDEQVSVYARTQWAARADVFVSLHVAGSEVVSPGPALYTYANVGADAPVFVAHARKLLARPGYPEVLARYARPARSVSALADRFEYELGRLGLTPRRGETPLYLLSYAPGAAVLFEMGALRDAGDRARLADPAQQSAYAQVIARAVDAYLRGGR